MPTIKSIISTTNQENYSVLTIYYGIDMLTRLCKTGTLEQKRALSKRILEHDPLTIVYDVRRTISSALSTKPKLVPQRLENYPYFIVRITAAEFLATMAKESDYFTAQADMAVPAEIIFRCCQACLTGPAQAKEEMNDPSRRWTTRHVWEGQRRVSSDRNTRIIKPTPITR